jgi:putative intracellular protease/amidase
VQRGKLPQRTRHICPVFSRPLALIVWLQVLTARGATFVDGGNWACNVQQDGQVFTGQNPMSATAIGKAIAAALASA